MLKQFNLIMILGVSFFLTGCAADSGNTKLAKTSNEQINSVFVKGKTTQTVVNWFSAGTDDTTKKLVLIFKDGILVDFSSSSAKGETKAGLLR